jgi:2-hydroxy-6-oxonona-2,4-dienedioate hydrolase
VVSDSWRTAWADDRRIEAGGHEVRYREAGHGPAIVLVHGLGASSDYWSANGPALAAAGFRVLAPDLPGFGASPPGKWAAEDPPSQAAALAEWAAAIDLGPAVWVGHSLSCQSVLELAASWPALVTGLVLAGPTGAGGRLRRVRQLVGLARDKPREPPPLVATVLRSYLQAGPVRVFRTWWKGAAHDPMPLLAHVFAPGLVVVGDRDPVVDRRFVVRLADGLREGRLVWVRGGAHAVQRSRPAAFNREVERFARSLPGFPATPPGSS